MQLGLVTTCYGHAQFLPELLASIEAQTMPLAHHVVVSDGDAAASSLFDAYVAGDRTRRTHIARATPGGPAVAWNAAIRAMPSYVDWLQKMDADDVLHAFLVEDLTRASTPRRASSVVDVIVPALWHFGVATKKPAVWRFPPYSIKTHLANCCAPAQAAFRREYWSLVGGFDETMPSAEDWDFFARLGVVRALNVVSLSEPRWGYRQHRDASASTPFRDELPVYQHYARGHTRASVLAQSRTWRQYCAQLAHGHAHWLGAKDRPVLTEVNACRSSFADRALRLEHYWQTIEHTFWFRSAYEQLIASLPHDQRSTWVEVGAYHGASIAWLGVEVVNRQLPVTLHAVDTFDGWPGVAQGAQLRRSFTMNTHAIRRVLADAFVVHDVASTIAAQRFADESCDVVWLDADHSFDAVRADVNAWWPKVRRGGVLGGDDWDFQHPTAGGVARAVQSLFPPSQITLGDGDRHGARWRWWMVRK